CRVAGADVNEGAALRLEPAKEKGGEAVVLGVAGQGAVEKADDVGDVVTGHDEGTEIGARLRHQQRGAEAVAADVADDNAQAAAAHRNIVEVVAAGGLGRIRCPADVEAGEGERRGWEKFLLNAPGDADLFAETLGFPVLPGLGELSLVLLVLDLPQQFGLLFDLLRLLEYLDKHGDLGAENFRDNRLEEVIDRAKRIAFEHLHVVGLKGCEKNDRRMLAALTL